MRPAGIPSRNTILYVEDDRSNQELMQAVIRKRPGIRLMVAALGAEGLEVAVAERPTLILLDRHLPDMPNGELLQRLRARRETESIPLIIVSGDTATPREHEANLGVIGYLTKPINIHELLAQIDQALEATPEPPQPR